MFFQLSLSLYCTSGCVEDSNTPMCMEHLDELTFEGKGRFQHLRSRIYLSEPNVPVTPLNEVGTGDMSEDMVSVAVQIKVDTLNNNKVCFFLTDVIPKMLMLNYVFCTI